MEFESIQELFCRSVDRFGSRTVVEGPGGEATYEQLEAGSNRLAHLLLSHDVEAGAPVVILAGDVAAIVSSVLGVLKARCLFVPLEIGTPVKRLEAMIAEVGPAWFVVDGAGLERLRPLAAGLQARVVLLDDGEIPSFPLPIEALAASLKTERVLVRPEPDDRCYVFFTSGSTGAPKGIVGRLKGIDHFIRWEIETFAVPEGARVSQLASPAFDAFLRDVFVPLAVGGTICVPPSRDAILDSRRLAAWIDAARVELIHCVPSLLRSLLNESLTPERFPSLRRILLAGEPLLPADVRRWAEIFGDRVELVNLYGPSETTMVKLFYRVQPTDGERASIPVGKPMRGAAALVLDGKGQARGTGQVGEIVLRTPYRTHGYLGRPELTDEAFVPNPFTGDSNDRVYKTGDLGRVLADGNFEFLGRKDHQVKIRGIRVELGEVEAALRRHPAVREAAVAPHDDAAGNKFLCAYLVLSEAAKPGELRELLASSLSEAMIPSYFVALDELPRTLSGKLDRRALPPPAEAGSRLREGFAAPRTPIEELLAEIWTEVLRLDRVGIRDSFFELGGHSLLATQVLARVRQTLEVDLPLRTLFRTPTISGLAQAVEEEIQKEQGLSIPPLVRRRTLGEAPLSFSQQRLWFMDQLQPGSPFYNIFAAVRLTGELDIPALRQACAEIVRRHESLRTVFASRDGEPVQILRQAEAFDLPAEDLRQLPESERRQEAVRRVTQEANRPFDLTRGPLVRCSLLRLGENEHVMTLALHHIVGDGWSVGVFIRELVALYQSFVDGKSSPLPDPPVQYADFAAWQREWLQGDVLSGQLAYWKERLAGAPSLIRLRTDHPRPAAQSFQGGRRTADLPADLAARLKVLSRGEDCTLFMTLLAAFQVLLHLDTGEEDVLVGSPLSSRNWQEIEGLIGFFVNTLVFRGDLSGDPSFRELLGRTRRSVLDAFAHQHLPFHRLVEELRPERSLAHSPIFQVGFTFQTSTEEPVKAANLTAERFDFEVETTQFDLNLSLSDTAQGLIAVLQYSRDLFAETTIEWTLERFRQLLELVAASSDLRLSEIGARLAEAEKKRWSNAQDELRQASLESFRSRSRRGVVVAGSNNS
ncbi:MAG TPA: amino acid adenylation domain-containing protein [Thermoanaerobaculia bacterium]|nr:amino acid adenylation domain-containing protein [Thermoanaerobaculia bacterium]